MKSPVKTMLVTWVWGITLVGVVTGGVAEAPDPDLNNDGVVNILDVSLVGSCFGQDVSTNPQCQVADTDGDGDVDSDDLSFVVAAFGQIFPTADTDPPAVAITEPADGRALNSSLVTVSGLVDDPTATVEINGTPAPVTAGVFSLTDVALQEGDNVLTAVATDPAGNVGTASITVNLDTTPPPTPRLDEIPIPTNAETVTIRGATEEAARVKISGGAAPAEGTAVQTGVADDAAGATFAIDVELIPLLENSLSVTAADALGNVSEPATLAITRDFTPPSPPVLFTERNTTSSLTQTVCGTAEPGSTVEIVGGASVVSVNADTALGLFTAAVALKQNADNALAVTAADPLGNESAPSRVLITHMSGAPSLGINVIRGGLQVGIVGEALPLPLVVKVMDDSTGGPIAGESVTFSVKAGGGLVNAASSVTNVTDAAGQASVNWTLGTVADEEQMVMASFTRNAGVPVIFLASGLAPNPGGATSFVGVVIDYNFAAIPEAGIRFAGTGLATTTDSEGRFALDGVPTGRQQLLIDGSTSARPETFPGLHFDVDILEGQENSLGRPILLPAIDTAHGVFITGSDTEPVILTTPTFPGLSLEIQPGSVTFPDGQKSGLVSATGIPPDRIPMPLLDNGISGVILTIQPGGVKFDPPARITFPNVDGLPAGTRVNFSSFDLSVGDFALVGQGTVNADGTRIISDPGVGIREGAWHAAVPARRIAATVVAGKVGDPDLFDCDCWSSGAKGTRVRRSGEVVIPNVPVGNVGIAKTVNGVTSLRATCFCKCKNTLTIPVTVHIVVSDASEDRNANGRLDAEDTNGNGVLDTEDLNGNGLLDTEDLDGDGVLGMEDTNGNGVLDFEDDNLNGRIDTEDLNGNGVLDTEDVNGDLFLNTEDLNLNGMLDTEDANGNGVLDFEDKNRNGVIDTEDANGNGSLDTEDANDNGVLDTEDANGNDILDTEDKNGNGALDTEDTNGNGVLDTEDKNGNGVLDTEDSNGNGRLDPGEDANGDGVLDTEDENGNGALDTEDRNGNRVLDSEDANGNGVLDTEDKNGNGVLDTEDVNGNDVLDSEDKNGNGVLDTEDVNGNGALDFEDINFNGRLDTEDANGNGVLDREDVNGNGILDTEDRNLNGELDTEDENGNGILDTEDTNGNFSLDDEDLNGNGVLDSEDKNKNGRLDIEDTDGNGVLDHEDDNGNGLLDRAGRGSQTTVSDARLALFSASLLWQQCCVKLEVGNINVLSRPQAEARQYDLDDLDDLINRQKTANTLNVYFVQELDETTAGFNVRDSSGVPLGTVIADETFFTFLYRTVAHEVGHFLGLSHPDDRDDLLNIMFRTASNVAMLLTEAQCDIVRDPNSEANKVNGAKFEKP